MSKKILIDAFYGQFSNFLEELSKLFPGDSDFPAYRTSVLLIKKANPNLVIKEIMSHVIPFEDMIRARDAGYFLGGRPSQDAVDLVSSQSIDPVLDKLRGCWRAMSDENRKVVWDYMILLIEIAKRYSAQ